jgi:hypothetical protein
MWWNVTGHTRPRQIAVATANAAIWTARPVRSSAASGATAPDLARLAVRSHRGLRDLAGLAANLADFMPISAWTPAGLAANPAESTSHSGGTPAGFAASPVFPAKL